MPNRITIPEDAPFTPEQRGWLAGFLSQVLGGGVEAGPAAGEGPVLPVTILFGSQTGNAESCARRMAKVLNGGRFDVKVVDMAEADRERLPAEAHLLVITSTYGDGEPPDNAADLYDWILGEGAPSFEGVKYSVFSLGDSEYPDFCKVGVDLDTRLAALGAERIHPRIDCDVDFDEPFAEWGRGVLKSLGAPGQAMAAAPAADTGPVAFGKKHPFPAPILVNRNLNKRGSARQTHHLELSLEGSGLEYEAGDALAVVPRNDEVMVGEILRNLPFRTNDGVPLPGGGEAPLGEALVESYEIRALTPRLLHAWQKRSGSPYLRSLVEAGDKGVLKDFCWGRELVDLVLEHPADFDDAEEFVSILKKLQPRLYSIASSPKAHPGEVHLTVTAVRYESHGRERGGACSTFLVDRSEGRKPGVFVHRNKAFRLPKDGDVPIIMVGPGTGIAPFRAFLEERRETGERGDNWLLFGNPYRDTDFLYEEELLAMRAAGILTRFQTAFSRDQNYKIYVQNRMLEEGRDLWGWLQDGAVFYVCGDASRMAKDVDLALRQIAEEHGGLSAEDAANYVKELRRAKRYIRDVY